MASPETVTVSPAAARRFLVRTLGLNGFQSLPDVGTALSRLEFVQMDSINVCGRIHDLVLWTRVADYSEQVLAQYLYDTSPRGAFEYYFPNLSILPLGEYPYFAAGMRRRAAAEGRWGALTEAERPVAEKILALTDAGGPLRTRTAGDEDGHTVSGWGTRTRLLSHVADKLFLHGTLGIARRSNFERSFDRSERLYPASALAASLPDAEEERRFRALKRLRTRRLFRAKPDEVAALGKGALVTVEMEGYSGRRWQALAEDADALRDAESGPVADDVLLLAPLDPLVYDRERTRALFEFDYLWEVYTPEAKRRWGYYVLPILRGDRLVGRVDPKIDRRTKTLTLNSLTLEPGVDADALAPALAARLQAFGRFLGAERIDLTRVEPDGLRVALARQGL